MIKVYIGMDQMRTLFLWNQEILDILDPDNYMKTVEIPAHIYQEYVEVMEQYKEIQDKLEPYYRESIHPNREVERAE